MQTIYCNEKNAAGLRKAESPSVVRFGHRNARRQICDAVRIPLSFAKHVHQRLTRSSRSVCGRDYGPPRLQPEGGGEPWRGRS